MEARVELGKASPIPQPVMGGALTVLSEMLALQLEGVGVGGATEVALGKMAEEEKRLGVVVVDMLDGGYLELRWRRC